VREAISDGRPYRDSKSAVTKASWSILKRHFRAFTSPDNVYRAA
jgi:hypothetical protein